MTFVSILIPTAVFIIVLAFTLWLRRTVYLKPEARLRKVPWIAGSLLLLTFRMVLDFWCLLVSACLSVAVSALSSDWKEPVLRGLWTLFLFSLVFIVIYIVSTVITYNSRRRKKANWLIMLTVNSAQTAIILLGLLVLWEIWGVPGSPLETVFRGLRDNWTAVLIPAGIFLATFVVLFYLRRLAYSWLIRWYRRIQWEGSEILTQTLKWHSVIWCFIFGAYLALVFSGLAVEWKTPAVKVLWSIFIASFTAAAIRIAIAWFDTYGEKWRIPRDYVSVLRNTCRIIILVVMVLIVMEMWGLPTSPILLLIVVLILAAGLTFRDAIPNLFASFQLSASQQIKPGDYIKLESGETGIVQEMNWNNMRIKTPEGGMLIIPNSRLIQHPVVNYGRILSRASEPFRFNTRTHLTELTGLKARNLYELTDHLRKAPDAVVYYHTHRFLEQQHYLTPEPSNDFAVWVSDALGDDVLGEALASVDTFEFPSLSALRDRLVAIIDEHFTKHADGRQSMDGRDFYFMKTVTVILPTPYIAYDLREFINCLRKISLGSLYFHMFESRLRLGTGTNDLSLWLEKGLGEAELGKEIAHLDPYTYTLEGLRFALIRIIEKRIL